MGESTMGESHYGRVHYGRVHYGRVHYGGFYWCTISHPQSYRKKFYQKYLWICECLCLCPKHISIMKCYSSTDAPKVASEKSKEEEAAAKLQ